ncbi:hypothetical protein CCP2SC5_1990002 [Azospirillaceae bacterium]
MTISGNATVSGTNTGDQTITLSGDASGSGIGSIVVTLANSGVTAGTYTNVTVDAKGRVTAGTNPSSPPGALSNSTTSTQDGYFGDLYLKDDTNPSHYLKLTNAQDLSVACTLSISTGNADRTLTITGNATVSGTNTGDQTIATISGLQTALDAKAPLASPSFTGTASYVGGTYAQRVECIQFRTSDYGSGKPYIFIKPGAAAPDWTIGTWDGSASPGQINFQCASVSGPTPTVGDNSTKFATTAFVASCSLPAGFRNAVINGCCRVTHRAAKTLSGSWQYAQVDLLAVRADGSPTAGTIKQATGVTSLSTTGYACLVQGATLGSGGAIWWRHRIEARDAARLRSAAAVLSARVYHDVGSAVTFTITINKPNAADDFSAVTQISTGTVSIANTTNADLIYSIADMTDCSNGLEILIKAACGAVSNKWFYLGDLQLEPGAVKTVFERRPMANEIQLVNRYLRTCSGLIGKANSASNMQISLSHLDMRIAPAYEATGTLAFTDAVTADFTQSQANVSVNERTADNGRVSCGYFSGLTSGTILIQRGTGGVILASAEF